MTRRSRLRRQQLRLSTSESHAEANRAEEAPPVGGRRTRLVAAISAMAVVLAVSFWLWKTYGSGNRGSEAPSGGATDNQQASLHSGKEQPGAPETGFPPGHNSQKSTGHFPPEGTGTKKEPDN